MPGSPAPSSRNTEAELEIISTPFSSDQSIYSNLAKEKIEEAYKYVDAAQYEKTGTSTVLNCEKLHRALTNNYGEFIHAADKKKFFVLCPRGKYTRDRDTNRQKELYRFEFETRNPPTMGKEAKDSYDDLEKLWNSFGDAAPVHFAQPKTALNIFEKQAYHHFSEKKKKTVFCEDGDECGMRTGVSFKSDSSHNYKNTGDGGDQASNSVVANEDYDADEKTGISRSWVQQFKGIEGDVNHKGILNSVEEDVANGYFSRGMSHGAENKLGEMNGVDFGTSGNNIDMTSSSFIDASVFGGEATFSFDSGNAESRAVYMTFSGGGHSMEFSSTIKSNIDTAGYSYVFEARDEVKNTGALEFIWHSVHAIVEGGQTGSKSVSKETAMAWVKHGDLEVTYTLGDGDPYDKFVLKVAFDKRFGTPIFQTVGGASKCPGEPNTMWRETGLEISTKHSPGSNNFMVLPGNPALYDVIITNGSPYRERHIYGLLLTSGDVTGSSFSGGNMLDLKFSINGDDKFRPVGDLMNLRNVP